jgi:hypothetical protein
MHMHPADDIRHLNGQVRHGNYGVAGAALTFIMLPKPVSSSRGDLRVFSCQHVGFFDLSLL